MLKMFTSQKNNVLIHISERGMKHVDVLLKPLMIELELTELKQE